MTIAKRGSRAEGFTLIELMMVVAIIGLLASLAIPGFQRYIHKSRLVEGVYSVSKILGSARAFMDAKSKPPCDSTDFCGGSGGACCNYCECNLGSFQFSYGWGSAPNMPFAEACNQHGGAFPPSTLPDFNAAQQIFDDLQFSPEGYYRFKYYVYGLMYRFDSFTLGGFTVTARADLTCSNSDRFTFIIGALLPTAQYTYFAPFQSYGYSSSSSQSMDDWRISGPVIKEGCQEWACP